jgi:hypothetical protein
MTTYLGLDGNEDLNFIIEYLVSNDSVEQKYKDKFIKNKLIPEYTIFEESEKYFTYSFHFENIPASMNVSFDKKGYYDWVRPKYRRLKLEKIMNKKCISLELLGWI